MSNFFNILVNGNYEGNKLANTTPIQKLTLRFAVVSLIYYGFAVIEGMIMRLVEANPSTLTQMIPEHQFYAILTAHPLVGIFGASYTLVFGAFYFATAFLMNKPLWNIKLAYASFWLITLGVFTFWFAGFLTEYAPLYTLYWPLPADYTQFDIIGGIFFIAGIALVMVASIIFVIVIFKTILYTPKGWDKQPGGKLFASAIGFTGLVNLFKKKKEKEKHLVPLPVVAIIRGSVDVLLNAGIITLAGVLILIYLISSLLGFNLQHSWVDALLYKNIYWWGLDLIADGLVLIFVAGTWYLMVMLITGKKNVYMENVARGLLLLELVVSWTVWSHHLLSDQAQPMILKLVSGQFVTAFELITQGLAVFISLVTLWNSRPLKWTPELKFLLGGLLGFALAVAAGIIQADLGMNRILHNTQWIVGPHVHVAVLVGLTMTLYAVVYKVLPILTNGIELYSLKLTSYHFWLHLLGGVGMGAFMGMAGLLGMLRRTLYYNGEFDIFMVLAALAGSALLVAYLAYFLNLAMTLGLKGILEIFKPSRLPADQIVPETN